MCIALHERINLNDQKMSPLGLLRQLPVVVYYGELIFEYEYLCEYEAKIENIYTLVCDAQDVL